MKTNNNQYFYNIIRFIIIWNYVNELSLKKIHYALYDENVLSVWYEGSKEY